MQIDNDWLALAIRLMGALVFGGLIGFERDRRGHAAGLRTHAIASLSAATITVSALLLAEEAHARGADADPLRVVQGLAQAIGFIAGGLIFVRGGDVRNMTTATSLWMAAAGGIVAGAGQWRLLAIAGVATVLLLTLDAGLRRLSGRDEADTDGPIGMPNRRGNAPDAARPGQEE